MSAWYGRLDLSRTESGTFAKKGVFSVASVAVQGLVRFAYSVIIGRLLTPAVLSATNSAISLALFVSLLWPTATASAAGKFIARAQGEGDAQLTARVASHLGRVTILSSLLFAIPAGLFSYFFQDRGDLTTCILVVLLVVAWSTYTFVRGIYFAVGQIGRALTWDTTSAVVAIGLLIVVVFFHWNSVLLIPITVGYGLYAIVGWPRRVPGGSGLARALRSEINGFTFWTVIGTLASTGFLQLTMIVAHAVGTASASGMYAAALTLATPASMLTRSFSLLLFPSMARATGRNDLEGVRRQTDLSTRGLVAIMGAIFGALIFLSAPVVQLFYGSKYENAGQILPILLAASLFVTLNVGAVNSLSTTTSTGVRIPALLSAIGMAVGLGSMLILVPLDGVQGVAWAYMLGTLITGFGPIVFVWRSSRLEWRGLWLRFLGGALTVVALVVANNALKLGYAGDAASLIVFLIVWLALMRTDLVKLNSVRKVARI